MSYPAQSRDRPLSSTIHFTSWASRVVTVVRSGARTGGHTYMFTISRSAPSYMKAPTIHSHFFYPSVYR